MLSILIPVYNYDVNPLVNSLAQQCDEAPIDFEIILIDDASEQKYRILNAKLDFTPQVRYFQNEYNTGRAKLRNTLASKAKFPNLLFIDCDASVITSDYIRKYINEIIKNSSKEHYVVNGGIQYRETPPGKENYLRWFYGINREQIPAEVRNQHPYRSFTPFNVLLSKSIFDLFEFDESLTTYGHEDTLFGYQLQQHGIPYYHTDNPLYHDGLDKNREYLKKIDQAIDNLVLLIKNGKLDRKMTEDIRLLKAYERFRKWNLLILIRLFHSGLEKNLTSRLMKSPSLFILDVYKLGRLTSQMKR